MKNLLLLISSLLIPRASKCWAMTSTISCGGGGRPVSCNYYNVGTFLWKVQTPAVHGSTLNREYGILYFILRTRIFNSIPENNFRQLRCRRGEPSGTYLCEGKEPSPPGTAQLHPTPGHHHVGSHQQGGGGGRVRQIELRKGHEEGGGKRTSSTNHEGQGQARVQYIQE